jgi:hypothetical protein
VDIGHLVRKLESCVEDIILIRIRLEIVAEITEIDGNVLAHVLQGFETFVGEREELLCGHVVIPVELLCEH